MHITLLHQLLIWPTEDQILQTCDYLKTGVETDSKEISFNHIKYIGKERNFPVSATKNILSIWYI